MSISSDSDGPSWVIPLMNAGELLKMDSYEEVSHQGQAPPLSPAYVPDPMELDEHVPVYNLGPKLLEHHVPSDDDMQVEDQPYADDALPIAESPGHIADSESMEEDSIDYPNELKDDDEDPEEDHTDYPADGGDGDDEPSDDDTDDLDREPTEDEARDTEAFETDEAHKTVRLEPPMSASIKALIAEHAAAHIPPTSPAYDQAPLGHRTTMIRIRDDILEEDVPPQRRFILTAPSLGGDSLIRSLGHDAWTIARAADKAEDVGYVRTLQASEHRMMTSIEEVNLRISYQAQVRRQKSKDFYTQLHDARTVGRDIRLEIDIVRG
nr:hypothetical protein [Tanacetum cinerariifolium]